MSSRAATSPSTSAASTAPRPPGVGAACDTAEPTRNPAHGGESQPTSERLHAEVERDEVGEREEHRPAEQHRNLAGSAEHVADAVEGAGEYREELLDDHATDGSDREAQQDEGDCDAGADDEPLRVREREAAERLAPGPHDEDPDQGDVARQSGDGVESDRDGFEVSSAALEITKVATVLDDPFNGTTFPKAIPGATVEYVITVENTGTEDADNVVITDAIDTDVNMIFDFYGGHDVEIVNNLVTVTPCDVENLADSDGCGLSGQDLTIGDPADLALTVVASTIMTITYRVTIP